jgi:hypothetical protein
VWTLDYGFLDAPEGLRPTTVSFNPTKVSGMGPCAIVNLSYRVDEQRFTPVGGVVETTPVGMPPCEPAAVAAQQEYVRRLGRIRYFFTVDDRLFLVGGAGWLIFDAQPAPQPI